MDRDWLQSVPLVDDIASAVDASHSSVALCFIWFAFHVSCLALSQGRWYKQMYKSHALAQFVLLLSDDWADLTIGTELAMYCALFLVRLLPFCGLPCSAAFAIFKKNAHAYFAHLWSLVPGSNAALRIHELQVFPLQAYPLPERAHHFGWILIILAMRCSSSFGSLRDIPWRRNLLAALFVFNSRAILFAKLTKKGSMGRTVAMIFTGVR